MVLYDFLLHAYIQISIVYNIYIIHIATFGRSAVVLRTLPCTPANFGKDAEIEAMHTRKYALLRWRKH